MNEKKGKDNQKKKACLNGEKKFYLFSAIGCAATLVAILVVALVVGNIGKADLPTANLDSELPTELPKEPDEDEEAVTVPEGMTVPLETIAILNDYGFYHNQTLNSYYEHAGIDFMAAAGTAVKAVDSGVVESIYKDDILTGTEITVDHGDGVKTVYRFVTADEDLTVGTAVKRGERIATIAEATGDEYKDGAHLHFEIKKDGKSVDPAAYLTFEEK